MLHELGYSKLSKMMRKQTGHKKDVARTKPKGQGVHAVWKVYQLSTSCRRGE